MKRSIFFRYAVSAAWIFVSCTPVQERQGGMEKSAATLASEMSVGWNLGNSLEAYSGDPIASEVSWGNPATTKGIIDSVAAAGFNAVRIPVRWYPHLKQTGEIDRHWMDRVKEVVDYCLDNNMYVILNTHHELWLENLPFYKDSAEVYRQERALWTQIACAFQDYDEHLLFAGTNEVHIADDWGRPAKEQSDVQNGMNRVFVEAVRVTGKRNTYRTLVIQTYAANPDYGTDLLEIPSDPTPERLMIEVHYYAPYEYCLAGEDMYWGSPYRNGKTGQEEEMNRAFAKLRTRFVAKGYPVILGECGASRTVVSHENEHKARMSRAYYYKQLVSSAKRNGLVPFVWDNGQLSSSAENFGLFDRKNKMRVADKQIVQAIMEGVQTGRPSE